MNIVNFKKQILVKPLTIGRYKFKIFKQALSKAIENHENDLSAVIVLGEALDQVRIKGD